MWYTYVLLGKKSNRLYTGCTYDLQKRFKEHTEKSKGHTQKDTYQLIYYEACNNKKDAFMRETYLKTGMGKRYLKNRLKRFLSLTG